MGDRSAPVARRVSVSPRRQAVTRRLRPAGAVPTLTASSASPGGRFHSPSHPASPCSAPCRSLPALSGRDHASDCRDVAFRTCPGRRCRTNRSPCGPVPSSCHRLRTPTSSFVRSGRSNSAMPPGRSSGKVVGRTVGAPHGCPSGRLVAAATVGHAAGVLGGPPPRVVRASEGASVAWSVLVLAGRAAVADPLVADGAVDHDRCHRQALGDQPKPLRGQLGLALPGAFGAAHGRWPRHRTRKVSRLADRGRRALTRGYDPFGDALHSTSVVCRSDGESRFSPV